MDQWLSTLLSAFARDLVCGAVDQFRYPCCFNDFVEDLQKEESTFNATLNDVEKYVEDCKDQVKENAEVIDNWLKGARPLKGEVEGLLEEARTNKAACFPKWIWKYRHAKKLAKKKAEVEKCIVEGRPYAPLERAASLPGTLPLPSQRCLKFPSRQSAYEKLMEALKDDEVTMIGLYGMGGCGKTTLAEELICTAKAEGLFDYVPFVPVSSKVEVGEIQKKIASALRLEILFNGSEERERAQILRARLTREGKRTLVILDDVWQCLDFRVIGIPFGEDNKNCKVMITTRSQDTCNLMDCQRILHLSTLTDEEAWALFQKQARISKDSHETLKKLGRQISDECKGLPVAIAALGGTLKGKAEDVWKVALDRLKNSKPVNIEKGLENPYKCLEESYNNLDTKEAKSLLLLCSVFPEEYFISAENLTIYAIGLGLAGEVGSSFERARNEVSMVMNKLISSSLVSSSFNYYEGECVKMHDLIRDVALWIASKENKAVKCDKLEKGKTLECSSIRYMWCKKFPNELDCSCIEFLWLKTRLQILDEIFEGMERLRVLILGYDGNKNGSPLTMSFKTLTNLRCLVLEGWQLGDISSMEHMKKLESLVLFECSFFELPNNVITQLTNLKLLKLSMCWMKRGPFEVIGRHRQLEELYYDEIRSSDNGDHDVFFKISNVPQALRSYQIKLGSMFGYHDTRSLTGQRILVLSCFDTSNAAVKELAKKAEVLLIAKIMGGAKNIIPDIFQIDGEGAKNYGWVELRMRHSKEIQCLVDTSNHSQEVGILFFKLRKLRIEDMEHLGALYRGVPPSGLFEKLEQLYIQDCPVLTCLFTPAAARSLVQLQKLMITNCEGLKHVLLEDDDSKICRHDDKLVFSKLKLLHIRLCSMLKYTIPVTFAQGLVQLESLEIFCCHNLKYVFGQASCGDENQNELKIELPILENLQLRINHELISIFPKYCSATCPSLREFCLDHSLKFDIRSINTFKFQDAVRANEKHLQTLETLSVMNNYSIESIFSLKMLELTEVSIGLQRLDLWDLNEMKFICVGLKNSFTFQNLKKLVIWRCKKLEVIFPASILRCLPRLEYLEITGCQELKQIIEVDVENQESSNLVAPQPCFPKLASPFICNCTSVSACNELPNLENQKSPNLDSPQPCFPKLASLFIEDCNSLKRLFYTSVSACNELPNLEFLTIMGASELEELISCGEGIGDVKVQLPKLKLVMLKRLPSLCQEIELPTLTLRAVYSCAKLNLTSSLATLEEFEGKLAELETDLERKGLNPWDMRRKVREIIRSEEVTEVENPSEEDETASSSETFSLGVMEVDDESNKKFDWEVSNLDIPSVATSPTGSKLIKYPSTIPWVTPPHKMHLHLVGAQSMSEPSLMNQQKPTGETRTTTEIPQSIEETQTTADGEVPASQKLILPTFGSEIPTPLHKKPSSSVEDKKTESVQEADTSEEAFEAAMSAGIEGNGLGVVAVTHTETGTSQNQKMQNVDNSIQKEPNLMDKEGEIGIGFKGSTMVHPACADTSGSHLSIVAELEAFKHNVDVDIDDAQIALLAEAIAVYPHLRKVIAKFSARFQALMLKTLADMLSFLRNESATSVTPQQEKEFQELCDEAVQLGFDKPWVDGMRQRVMVRDPGADQAETRLNELHKRHDQLTEELCKTKDEIDNLRNSVDSRKKCFDFL